MVNLKNIGVNIVRKEAWNKVTGRAKYNKDIIDPNILYGKILSSTLAHANIKSINIEKASKVQGVQSIITGSYNPVLSGSVIRDRPPIAIDKVRYFGEPVALVVANTEEAALEAINLIEIEYEPLPIISNIRDGMKEGAFLIHENLHLYEIPDEEINYTKNTNICNTIKIRKGDIDKAFNDSPIIIESSFTLPQSDHIAMETRNAKAEILPDGKVIIESSTQAPFSIKEELSELFNIPEGDIVVKFP